MGQRVAAYSPAKGLKSASAPASTLAGRLPVKRSAPSRRRRVEPAAIAAPAELPAALSGRTLVVAAGAAGVVLLPLALRQACADLRVAIDLNAVPPARNRGLGGHATRRVERDGVICYGAIGVGETKMKIHKAAIARLFESNDQILDAEEVFAIET